jgi:outer membrane protein
MFFHSSVFAQGNIGVINLEGAISVSNYSRQQYKVLQADPGYKKLAESIEALEKELQALQKEGEKKSLTWSEEQKQAHVKKGQAKLAEYNRRGNQLTQVRNSVALKVEQALGPKIEKIVNDVITEKNIGLLLKSQAVYFRTADFDITDEVVKRLNESP